jgi:acylphosphatase
VKSVYILIGGKVQGVGFRYFTQIKAAELHISGWVRNTADHGVEIEAEGRDENLTVFIEWMKIGPARANVSSFHCTEISPFRNFNSFRVR